MAEISAIARRSEIAIRLALGEQRRGVLRLTLLDGLRPAFGGVVAGSLPAIASLYETKPLDPAVFAAVIGLLFAVAAAAYLLPAWRASSVEPSAVLWSESC